MTAAHRALAVAALLASALAAPAGALATTITVTTTADSVNGDGLCSLREAVIRANTDVSIDGECNPGPKGADVIVLGPGTFRFAVPGRAEFAAATGDLDLKGEVEIAGAGAGRTTVDGAGLDRVFDVLPGAKVTIRDLTITGGRADAGTAAGTQTLPGQGTFGGNGTPGACGGGIAATSATLGLSGVVVTGNAAGAGGTGITVGVSPALTGRGGDGGPGGAGGGVCLSSTPVTLTRSVVSANRAGAGGDGGNGFGAIGQAASGGVGAGGDGGDGIGGQGAAGGAGGGVAAFGAGVLTVVDSTIAGNTAGDGGDAGNGTGGVGGGGTPTGQPGAGYGNQAGEGGDGGGVVANAGLSLSRSTVSGNTAGSGGNGGVAVSPRYASAGNGGAGGDGGGISGYAAPQSLANVTLAANAAGGGGGGGAHSLSASVLAALGGRGGRGGAIASESDLTVTHATITGNGAGGPGGNAPGTVSGLPGAVGTPGSGVGAAVSSTSTSTAMTRSVFSGNGCDTTVVPIDGGQNISFGSAGCAGASLDPRLGTLTDNGGPTLTMRPGTGSPAIDRIPAGPGCPATDQRGAVRSGGAGCDVGAFEIVQPSATTGAASAVTGSTATVAGTVATAGLDTVHRIEFGTTTAYGRQVSGTTAGAAAATVLAVPLAGLTPLTTYHYRLVATGPDGLAIGADRTFTTTAATVAGGPGAPRVTGLRVRPRAFAVVPKGGALRAAARGRPALGGRVSLLLSESAALRVVIQRTVPGRRVTRKGRVRCVAVAAGVPVARAKRCVLHPAKGTLRVANASGAVRIVITGRVGRRVLAPGPYRVVVTAIDATGARSLPVRAPFTIVRRVG